MSDALTQEIERLREHNAELLAEMKKAKALSKDLVTQVETLTGERDHARTEVQRFQLDNPVSQMAERVSILPDHFLTEFGKGFQFARTDDGIQIQDRDGNPAMVKVDDKPRAATFTEGDVRLLCEQSANVETFHHLLVGSRASGGGALGGRGVASQPTVKPVQPQAAPVQFGLR